MECIYKFKPNSIRSLFFSDNEINFLLTGFAKTAIAKTLLSIAILWLIFGGHGLLAQNATISGTVSDLTGSPLPGASVQVKGTTLGSITDANGKYKVQASGGTILVISYIGYNSQEVVVGSRTAIDINLTPSAESLSEVVVVGYGSQKKADITGAVGSIKGSTLKTIVAGDAANLLQGQLAGVTVQSGGSAPGQAPAVVIRGSGTFGNDQPLYVIDGMIGGTMAFVNPNDIESIEVLKDASAAAIYGSRASNGVVLVTTKSGKAGEVKISFNARGGIQTPSKLLDMMNAKEYAAWNNLAHDNDKKVHAPVNQAYATGDNSRFDTSVDTDFQRLELSPAPMSDYNLSLSGGSNSAKYFISGGYFDQKGIAVDSWFKRYNMRANSIFTKGRFKFTESLSLSRSATNPNTYVGRETGPLPTMPVYDPKNDGGFAGLDPADAGVARVVNWYGLAQLNDNRITNDQALGNIGLEYEIIDGLKYKINLGLDYSSYRSFNFTPSFFFSNSQEAFQQQATLNDSHTTSFTTLIENTLNYTKSFGNHNFDVLTGYTSQQGSQNFLSASAANFPSNDLRVIDAAIDKTLPPSGNLQEFILRSFLGRINYNYKSKYLFTATIRRDASSKFLYPSNIFATFPSFSAGWKVSEEDFFPKNGLINDLKIRASYGSLGSQNIGNYLTAAVLNLNTDYYFAGGIQPGIGQTSFANRNLRWETTKTSDIGADMRLLNNTINHIVFSY
jgi:TonB-linked SusC/RagA family outer membrane protein